MLFPEEDHVSLRERSLVACSSLWMVGTFWVCYPIYTSLSIDVIFINLCLWDFLGVASVILGRHNLTALFVPLALKISLWHFPQWFLSHKCRMCCRCISWNWSPKLCIFIGCLFCNGLPLFRKEICGHKNKYLECC